MALLGEARATITAFRADHGVVEERLAGVEHKLNSVQSTVTKLSEATQNLSNLNGTVIVPQLESLRESNTRSNSFMSELNEQLQNLVNGAKAFEQSSKSQFEGLEKEGNSVKEQLEFLMQATDMIKRRSKEQTKTVSAKFKELETDQEKNIQQLAALERLLKKQEREVHAIERKTLAAAKDWQGMTHTGSTVFRALPMLEIGDRLGSFDPDPNERLRSVLDQLEQIASGGSAIEAVDYNPNRPPLPASGDSFRKAVVDSPRLARYSSGTPEQVPIDSARAGAISQTVRGMYGLSPRGMPTGKGPIKKKR